MGIRDLEKIFSAFGATYTLKNRGAKHQKVVKLGQKRLFLGADFRQISVIYNFQKKIFMTLYMQVYLIIISF